MELAKGGTYEDYISTRFAVCGSEQKLTVEIRKLGPNSRVSRSPPVESSENCLVAIDSTSKHAMEKQKQKYEVHVAQEV